MQPMPTSLAAWADALDSLMRYGAMPVESEADRRYVILSNVEARRLAAILRAAHPLTQPVLDLDDPD